MTTGYMLTLSTMTKLLQTDMLPTCDRPEWHACGKSEVPSTSSPLALLPVPHRDKLNGRPSVENPVQQTWRLAARHGTRQMRRGVSAQPTTSIISNVQYAYCLLLAIAITTTDLLSLHASAQSSKRIHLGFPDAWDGDKYQELYCPSKNIPKFLDGYFLCQLSASYGRQSAPPGQRLSHMIDAIGAVGSFHISNGQVVFSAQYYPARPFKIWEFYDRDMAKASVPWAGWSEYNLTAMQRWEQVPNNPNSARFHPNLDFWRVGHTLVAGTEAPYWVGYQFDVRTLSRFKLFPFVEDNDVFREARPTMVPISMAIHERVDADGTLWGSFSAMNFDERRFYQGIFTIDASSVRRVVALYDYGVWQPEACSKDDEYTGDKMVLPGYLHSITSTENFIILPITSLLINPCKFKEPPLSNPTSAIQSGGLWGMDFYEQVPMRFLVFDKRSRHWVTPKPLEVFPSMFVTHQLNAFEALTAGTLIADMIVYDSVDPYVKYFYTDFLTSQVYPSTARILRFTLDIHHFKVMYSYLIPRETIAADFAQTNHLYDGRPYQWAYLVEHPFAADNTIVKINVDDPAGARNLRFKTDPSLVMHEPWFVSRPDATREDDGVLLIRALDLEENKGVLLVVDATSMVELGRAYVPISIPFGFHNRFFSKRDLGLHGGGIEGVGVGGHYARVNDREPRPAANSAQLAERRRSRFQSRYRNKGDAEVDESVYSGGGRRAHKWRPHVKQPFSGELGHGDSLEGSEVRSATTRNFWRRILTTPAPPPHSPTWVPVYPGGVSTPPAPLSVHNSQLLLGRPDSAPTTLIAGPPPLQPNSRPTYPFLPHIPSSVDVYGRSNSLPVAGGSRGSERETPTTTDDRARRVDVGETTVRELYDKTLKVLCKWLPKLVRNVTFDGCVAGGKKAARWMSPLANTYAENLRSESRQQSSSRQELDEELTVSGRRRATMKRMRPSTMWFPSPFNGDDEFPPNVLRPILTPRAPAPWYNYRTFAQPSRQQRSAPPTTDLSRQRHIRPSA